MKLILTFLFSVFLFSCSSSPKEDLQIDESELYKQASISLKKGNFQEAIEKLEDLSAKYPFGVYAKSVNLDLVYAYYKAKNYQTSLAEAEKFIRLNPQSDDLDWVYYLKGLNNLGAGDNYLHNFFGVDRTDRDPSAKKEAYLEFKFLVENYKDSPYANDAYLRMLNIREKLAIYEYKVANYNFKKEAFVASSMRAKYILENFPDTKTAPKALELLEQSYENLGLAK